MSIYRKELFETPSRYKGRTRELPSFLTRLLDKSIGKYLEKYQTADSRYSDRTLSYPNPDELPDQEEARTPKFSPKRRRSEDVDFFGVIPDKGNRRSKGQSGKYGNLTLIGRVRVQIGSMKSYFRDGSLSVRNNQIINNNPNNRYLQGVVERLNRKLDRLDNGTTQQIINDSTKKMSPREETEKGYRKN